MATIEKRLTGRGEPRYRVRIRVADHPPISRTFTALRDARSWARDIETEIQRGHLLPQLEAAKHSASECFARYEADGYLDQVSARHASHRRTHLRWWGARLGPVRLSELSPAMILEARASLVRVGRSNETANKYVAALSSVLEVAVREWMWCDANPCRRLRPLRESQGRVRFLSDDERERLLAAARESDCARLYPMIVLALATGARQGELLRLKWGDIDLTRDPPRATLHRTKNKDRRVLSFPGQAGAVLAELAAVRHISGYVFATSLTKGRPRFPRKAWLAAVDAAGLEDFRFHDLRHSAASYLAMSGATLTELATFLGHRSLASVRRYSHLTEDHSEGVATRMVERFLG